MLIATALITASLTLTERTSVMLAEPVVRVGDVAVGGGPVARVVIARLPRGRVEIALSRRALAALIRRAVPGVTVAEDRQNEIVTLRAPSVIRRISPEPARLPEPPEVKTGDRLTLVSRSGPVTVERQVTALQPGRSSRRLFVRDDAGQVSSIPLVGERAR